MAERTPTPTVALSLRQPWAWMVVHGGKTIENRRWSTRLRVPFLIHAAKGMTNDEWEDAVYFARSVDPQIDVPKRHQLAFGGIIGRARIVDVIPPHEPLSLPALAEHCEHAWHMPEQYGFVLADVAPLPFRALRGEHGNATE